MDGTKKNRKPQRQIALTPTSTMAHSTLRASFVLSLAVMASRVLGVVRESMFAALFGASAISDAYTVAFRIPNLMRDLFAEGALSAAFVPTFTKSLQNDGKAHAFRLGNLVVTGVLLVTGLLTLAGVVFSEQLVLLISGGFKGDDSKLALTSHLAQIMMPVLTLVSVSAAWMGMLNAQNRFATPAIAPALFNVVSIAGGFTLLVLGVPALQAVVWFALVTLLAGAVQGLCQVPSLWATGFRPRFAISGLWRDEGVRRIVRLMAPAVIGAAAVQINIFVNTRFAANLGDGPQTYLTYAFRLFYLPVGLFGVALATVTTTRVSEAAAKNDRNALLAKTAESLRGVWMLGSASTVGLIVLAEPVVTLLFERGEFTHADTQATALVLQAFLLGVLPYSMMKNLVPAFYAIDRPRLPMLASSLAVLGNVVFNALTYRKLGTPGLALGTTIGATINYLVLRLFYTKLVGNPWTRGWPGMASRLALANGVLGALAFGLHTLGLGLARMAGLPVGAGGKGLAGALVLFAVIVVCFAVYTRLLKLLGYPGAEELADLPTKLLRRLRR